MNDRLAGLPAVPLPQLLTMLAGLAARSRDQPGLALPMCTLDLRSGRSVQGTVLALSDSVQGRGLTVAEREPGGQTTGRLSYVDADQVAVVHVHAANEFAHLLAFGRPPPAAVAPAAAGAPPNRLDVRRSLTALAEQLQRAGLDLALAAELTDLTGEPLRCISELAEATVASLIDLASDELGRGAQGEVNQVLLCDGEPGVSRQGQTLVVRANLLAGASGRLAPAALSDAVSAVL